MRDFGSSASAGRSLSGPHGLLSAGLASELELAAYLGLA